MSYDVCVIGAGIVGLATALQLLTHRRAKRVLVLEKERDIGLHQTGHNSGVIHAGIYYKPGSLKAQLCRAGEAATKAFCHQHGIPFQTPGKLVVATDARELARLHDLYANAQANGIAVQEIDRVGLHRLEPNVAGLGALLVPSTGIVSYNRIAQTMAALIAEAGGEIVHGARVDDIREGEREVVIVAGRCSWRAQQVIVCAGLQADRLARRSGAAVEFQIIPFRGEYYAVAPSKRGLVRHLIYPVPNPTLPFLGIHLTPMIDGTLTVGPNAVLGLAREGYPRLSFDARDTLSFLRFPGFWRLMAKHLPSAVAEARNSLSKASYLAQCRRYCPSLTADDLLPYRAGIRAQAVTASGELIHDFLFLQTARVLHVCNAPSPAATSAIPIAQEIVRRIGGAPAAATSG